MSAPKSFISISAFCSLAVLGTFGAKTQPEPPTLEDQMLGHVEKVLIVDTINVPREAFFRHYNLSPSTGTVLTGQQVAQKLSGVSFPIDFVGKPFSGFTNEFEDYLIWAQQDTTGYLRLAESVLLVDGNWSTPVFTPAVLNEGDELSEDEGEGEDETIIDANAAFPFMLDDGQTLYFAADNDASLGGYDIFIATKDPSDGQFLIPGNLGMPFNSPYDDYMMVIDRQSGVGWWASDRNQLEDDITIYIYALSDERINVDPDDENLMAYATLSGWQDLQTEEERAEVARIRRELAAISRPDTREPQFTLQMPGGTVYHFYSDFKKLASATLMERYLRDKQALEKKKTELAALRRQYSESGRNGRLSDRILSLENEVRSDEAALQSLLSQIYKSESN